MLFSAAAPCLSIFWGPSLSRSTEFSSVFFPSRQDRYIDMHTRCIRDHCRNSGRHFLVRHFLLISKFEKDQYMVLCNKKCWKMVLSMCQGLTCVFGRFPYQKGPFFLWDTCNLSKCFSACLSLMFVIYTPKKTQNQQ